MRFEIKFFLFSLILLAFNTFQFHLHSTDFFEKLQKNFESRLQQEFKNLGLGVNNLLHNIKKKQFKNENF